jgi:hypothetical protein
VSGKATTGGRQQREEWEEVRVREWEFGGEKAKVAWWELREVRTVTWSGLVSFFSSSLLLFFYYFPYSQPWQEKEWSRNHERTQGEKKDQRRFKDGD